jgi:hypothetical protein
MRHPRGPGRNRPGHHPDPRACPPVPAGFPHHLLPAPWLVAEGRADPDRHTSEPHVHVDHIYAATTDGSRPVREPEHQVRWFTAADIATAPGISEDSRLLAARLLTLAASQPGPQCRWPPEQDQAMPAGHRAEATADTGAQAYSPPATCSIAQTRLTHGPFPPESLPLSSTPDPRARAIAHLNSPAIRRRKLCSR